MKNSITRFAVGMMAISANSSIALAQQVDSVTAPNSPGRVYVRMQFDNANDSGSLDVPFDSSFVAKDAGLDLLHLLDIPDIYGFDGTNDVGTFSLVTATTNILGTQVQARYIEGVLAVGQNGQPNAISGDVITDAQGEFVDFEGVGRLSITVPCLSGDRVPVRTTNAAGQQVVNFDGWRAVDQDGVYTAAPAGVSQAAFDNIESDYQDPYSVVFIGLDPNNAAELAFAKYEQFLDANSSQAPNDPQTGVAWGYRGSQQFSSSQMLKGIYGCSVSKAGVNPLVGNADSLQQQMVEQALDFTLPTFGVDEAPWGLGLRIGRVNKQGAVGTQYDARINRAFRLSEGSRALLILDVPVSYSDVKGVRTLRVSGAMALRYPVSRRWSLEPRVGFGYVNAYDQGLEGQVMTGSLSSLYMLDNIGRGSLTIGNMVGYTKVIKAELYGYDVGNRTNNVVFRNGFAYDLPLSGVRVGKRQSSVRASYAFTKYVGDELYTENIHEATLSMGVRTRETDTRSSEELFRFGLIGKLANNYKSGHLFIGYRF
ncbi:hypothetical protein [Novosphingobium colocasiae]|uniref:Uncharacterized protein n=1 Tax=Novosphingobium colocasiae TaxID=1256513 RepID=A0A918PC05_9SPHN|nr:hypothetical protein [Novosphingobium colocasiae]GGY97937.1 hypothetical protein GCM10011614_11340 [Novosphingobium colocasiae]